jgi:structural maintenance of chromosome 2
VNIYKFCFCRHFGVKEGKFDFDVLNHGEERKKLNLLEERQMILKRNVNVNVLDMIDRVESRDNSLTEMLRTVKTDKEKISSTIEALDDIKRETLLKTWHQVNEDFGAIFSDLLPGSFCKLEATNSSTTPLEGLEIRVKFGAVWKESLSELSGGQRSLTALALILALLKYRPAPFYILDEVDAALDLSHTQNIGNLLKKRFQSSQFIVVSLKEGMFTNANVLFKTKFKDGISSIERHEQENCTTTEMEMENEHEDNEAKKNRPMKTALARPKITTSRRSVKFN